MLCIQRADVGTDGLPREGGHQQRAPTHPLDLKLCQSHFPQVTVTHLNISAKPHNSGLVGKPVCFNKRIISKVKNFRPLGNHIEKCVCVWFKQWPVAVAMITFSCHMPPVLQTVFMHFGQTFHLAILLCPLPIHPLKYITVGVGMLLALCRRGETGSL